MSGEISGDTAARSLSQIWEGAGSIRLGVNLVSAARWNLRFLRSVSGWQGLHQRATTVEAIRRYDELWMPLISDLTLASAPPMVLPPLDVEWVWFCHTLNPSYPTVYAEDLNNMWDDMAKVVGAWETVKEKEVDSIKKLWERTFDQPYEKAGVGLVMEFERVVPVKPPVHWDVSDTDVNTKYKSMVPRFLLESSRESGRNSNPRRTSRAVASSMAFFNRDELMINWGSSSSTSRMSFCLKNQTSLDSSVMLLRGWKMQYQLKETNSALKSNNKQTKSKKGEDDDKEDDREGFVTLVHFSEENPTGRAIALLSWKLLVVELMPEEDAMFVLLLCVSILRSVSQMRKQGLGRLLIRRKIKEARVGARDWGSVLLHPSCSSISSPYFRPWHWNANLVMAASDAAAEKLTRSLH